MQTDRQTRANSTFQMMPNHTEKNRLVEREIGRGRKIPGLICEEVEEDGTLVLQSSSVNCWTSPHANSWLESFPPWK